MTGVQGCNKVSFFSTQVEVHLKQLGRGVSIDIDSLAMIWFWFTLLLIKY